ncbi:MAG: ATP-binding protein [Acidobacteria bacterium]|nr:ATP-binding protein [Acidobacteriota bacterium]
MTHDYPLADWISACQARDLLDSIIERVDAGRTVQDLITSENSEYMARLLKEEVTKQFSYKDRPVIEVILNAVDASQNQGGVCEVHITATAKQLSIQDNGASMDLEGILKFLILPFSTEKNVAPTGMYIGEFGVGFFSTLNYCLQNPQEGSVTVRTLKDRQSYEAYFYATDKDPSSLRLRLRKVGRASSGRGTTVTITKVFNIEELGQYVMRHVASIPGAVASIYFNKSLLNDIGGSWYSANAPFIDDRGQTVVQRVAVRHIEARQIHLTSRGVNVKTFDSAATYGLKVLFPALVSVVIGRDDFRRDENYYKGVSAAFAALEQLMANRLQSAESTSSLANERHDFVELIPSLLSAFGLDTIGDIPNLDILAKTLLPGKQYVVQARELERITQFTDASAAFSASPQSCAIWGKRYGSYQDFIKNNFKALCTAPAHDFARKLKLNPAFCPNVEVIFDTDLSRYQIADVELVSARPLLPFMIDEEAKKLYINAEHEYIRVPENSLKRSMALAAFLQLPIVKKEHKDPSFTEKQMLYHSGRMVR